MSQVNGPSMPPAHGGGYQPGSRVSPVQGQHYTQSNSQAHGGNYQPGQQHGQTVPIHQAPGPAQGRMPAAPHGVNAHQTFWQQQPQHPQQPNFIPNPIQPNSGYNPANQPYQDKQPIQREPFMGALELGKSRGIADTIVGVGHHHHRTYQRGYANLFHERARTRWKYPNSYQMPGLNYNSTTNERHRDILQRVHEGTNDDRYISPVHGHVNTLVVQAAQDVYDGPQNSTWRRTFIRNVCPIYMQLANFPFSNVPTDPGLWTGNDWAMVGLKWIPTCMGMLCMLLWQPRAAEGQIRREGKYDPVNYRYWGYPKAARNHYESAECVDLLPHAGVTNKLMIQRVLGPRYLCFLNEPSGSKMGGAVVRKVDQSTAVMPYIFIAYTAEQFEHEDLEDLHSIAERAAREAGVVAYWVGCSCMQDEDQLEDDVYRISDVMRGAQSLIIAIGPSRRRPNWNTPDAMLQLWGERMWTLPEALLSPADKDIKVYARGRTEPPRVISKKQLAAVVWNDPLISRQLVDHFNNTLNLSPLELVSIALNCLRSRNTTQHLPGDLSYALMGLLLQRPQIDRTDSDFQAFARLSLANDSDRLLERLICMLPKNQNASWLAMDDAWNSNLWDIYPECQVAGVGHDNAVMLDGAFGAAIRWKAFATVAAVGNFSWKRTGARIALHGAPLYFLIGIVLIVFHFAIFLAAILLLVSLPIILISPYLVRVIYSGKIWGSQAWFFGFEGYLDLATIESHIFGAYMGRLHWSPSGSSISKHRMNEHKECVGVDPTMDPQVKAMVERAKNSPYGAMKVFTLVDTYTLTVTMFLAVRPPVAVLMCGHEGGKQRAVLCSYDWTSQTFYRETVLRMETPVLEKMFRVNQFRFGLQRPLSQVH